MTVKDFLDVFTTKAQVSIVNNETDVEILNVKNDNGVSDNLATAISGATVKRINVVGATAVTVVIEAI